ncbi:DUF1501 domain-containing protein [Limnohabitans sp. 15K]|uniref:DUF1501 domain-containing protein n=1 Tax=Limnohabitans sp. 15K TaxID=1100706 RepID=UPI000C1E2604|nr:DUF1501 domain-containing protein [Limnohabitans sp. 15K]PIT81725.1 hypothetical protein B9Z40_08890 [Limnohabitans sp. 15K]
MTSPTFSRRKHLQQLALGAGILASGTLPARLAMAAQTDHLPSEQRLVVVLLRGALDGLAAVPAMGDPAWSALRGGLETPAALPLDSTFGMHPGLANLHRWYLNKELTVVHAVASSYRERSHFDAQQQLESGGDRPFVLSTGWLARALQASQHSAVAMTHAMPLALRGADRANTWTPSRRPNKSQDTLDRITAMYADDVPLASALAQAMEQHDKSMMTEPSTGAGLTALAKQAGTFLSAPRGPRVAWLEVGGWDTHSQQTVRLGRMLPALDEAMASLRESLSAHWATTTVLVMTEFGRSAIWNGSQGTDHGTGGVAFVAGGQVAGGQVLTDWPGLGRQELLEGRDLRPTRDIRSVIMPIVQRQFQLSTVAMNAVLPNTTQALDNLWRV